MREWNGNETFSRSESNSCFQWWPTFKLELERIRLDPKDGDLYLGWVKPGETLVEARSDTDVQIVRQIWA
jgi:hypothetical protein